MKVQAIVERGNRAVIAAASAAALIATLALAPGAFAQQQGQNYPQGQERGQGRGQRDPQQMIDRRISNLTQSLQLSADQQTRIRAILGNESTQMEALRQKNGVQAPQGRAQRPDGQRPDSAERGGPGGRGFGGRNMPPEVKALRDQTEKQIEGVLNSSQLTKYRELKAQREHEHQKREAEGRSGQRSS
jgi:hypothetical protein